MMKIEVKKMTDQIPLGKQLKYALQERDALQEMLKEKTYEWFEDLEICERLLPLTRIARSAQLTVKREQLIELQADLERAREEVSDIELMIWREKQAEHGMVLLQFEEEKLESSRILSFSVPEGTEEIEIFGTILLGESFILELQEKLKQEEEKAQILTQEEFEAMQREAIINYFEEQKAEEQALEQEYIAQEAWEKEQEDKRLDFLISSCGEGTVYTSDHGCIAIEEETVDSGPLINAIFSAMGIGLAVMIILWGIGKKRGHKKLSDDDT